MHNKSVLKVVKRDGREVDFDSKKIAVAIQKVIDELSFDMKEGRVLELTSKAVDSIEESKNEKITVEEIQDTVVNVLAEYGYKSLSEAYTNYRKERTKIRETKSTLMGAIKRIGVQTDRDNANVGNNFSSKLLRIASESNKWFSLGNMPKHLAKLHENGDLHYHDLDSLNLTTNCLHIPTREILQRGFNTGYGYIRPPKYISSAAELSCILLQSSQNDLFGGQSHPDFDNDMAPFVESTRQEIMKELQEYKVDKKKIKEIAERKVEKEVEQAMQSIVYNLNSMHSRAGSQVPFSSINIGIPESEDAALVCKSFLIKYDEGLGFGEQPVFPNIIFRVKKGVNREPGDPYYYLYKLALKVASKRMNPTFMNLDADFNKVFYDMGIIPATMGCRTYVCANVNGEPGSKGRGNIAPCTLNLVRIGILSKGSIDKFFQILDSRLMSARESLMYRYEVLKKLKVKDLPFAAGEKLMKGSEDLGPMDSIEPILKQGTWAIGFIGLAETLVAILGKHHGESKEAQELGLRIISTIRNFCDKYKEIDKLNWSCYATPAEGLSGRFVAIDKAMFGTIKGVTDKDYYTNSFHITVNYPISIKEKIDIEAPYHKLCNGGHITYIEFDNYPDADTIEDVLKYAYTKTNISYLGINFHIRYCKDCGTYLEPDDMKCPNCGGTDIQGISRVTGYLSLDERFGTGKAAERKDRLSNTESHTNVYDNAIEYSDNLRC